MTNIKPLDDRIVIKAENAEMQTASGIVIPDTASKEKPQKGRVVAIGPGRLLDNGNRASMDVKEGDMVLYSKYGPTEVKINGEDLLVVSSSDVLAILT